MAAGKKNSSKTSRGARRQQQWLILVAALLIIAASVASTLYFTGFFARFGSGEEAGTGFQNITFTDAYLQCENFTRERYQSRLQSLVADDHSSRYDASQKLYKIFFKLEMRKPPHKPQPEPYWVNCFVTAQNGRISHYQVGEAKDLPASPTGGGNALGWP